MAESEGLRKNVVRKYAKILQVDTGNPRPISGSISVRGSPLSASQTGMLEKLVMVRKNSETLVSTPQKPNTGHSIFKMPSPKFDISAPLRLDSSMNNSQRLMTTHSDNLYPPTAIEERNIRRFEEIISRLSNPPTTREGHMARSLSKSTQRDHLQTVCVTSPTNQQTRRTPSLFAEKEATIQDVYKGARGFEDELSAIINQEYERDLKTLIQQHNIDEFGEIQKSRITNIVQIIEKGFISKEAKESKIKKHIWKILTTELNKIRSIYDEFLSFFGETLEKVARGKQKIYDHMKPWEALKLLIDQGCQARQRKSSLDEGAEDRSLKKVHQFKVEYKVSKDFNPKILNIYELMETHIKELNQLIAIERERYQLMLQQQEKLIQEHSDQEKKQEVMKDEMLTIIRDWKKTENQKNETDGLVQEKHLQKHMDEIHGENIKLFDDNVQLKKDVKELRQEIKRILAKEEKAIKVFEDKEVMVDLYSHSIQTQPLVGLSMYIKDLDLCSHASVLPNGMMVAMMNMIFTEKMIIDACDDFERRPRKPLNAYITEWFLKRFGLHDFCETILPDFMLSIQTDEEEERHKVFKALLGTTSGQMGSSFRFSMERPTQLDKNKLRKAAFGTTKILKYFHRIVNCIKLAYGNTPNKIFAVHNYGPFLADTKQNPETLTLEIATFVLNTISLEENFTAEELKDAEEYLQIRMQQNLEEKLPSEDAVEGDDNSEKGDPPLPSIGLDAFVRFMLEAVLEKQIRGFEKYYASIKTHVLSKKQNNVSYDEYVASVSQIHPEASQAWKDHSFARLFSDQSVKGVPLFMLVENLTDYYFDEDKAKEDFKIAEKTPVPDTELNSARGVKTKLKKIGLPKMSSQASQFQPQSSKNSNTNNSNMSRYRLMGVCKEGLALGSSVLNELGYELYDCVSSLTLLQETYLLVEDSIRGAEKKNESLTPLHEAFVKDLDALPKQLVDQESIDALLLIPKDELVDMLEYLWGKLRSLLLHTFRK